MPNLAISYRGSHMHVVTTATQRRTIKNSLSKYVWHEQHLCHTIKSIGQSLRDQIRDEEIRKECRDRHTRDILLLRAL